MKIDGVVVLYKPDDELIDNIKSYIDGLNKLFVVDNTPNIDNSSLFNDLKKVEYIPLKENTGIAHALNIGASKAIKDKAEYLLTMDQDSRFRDGEFARMVNMLNSLYSNKDISLLMGVDINKIGIASPFHVTERTKGSVNFVRGIEFPMEVMCSGNLVNLNAYEAVGGFKDWMFIDCVDFEFCFNLQINGYRVIRFNEIKMDHSLGDTKALSFMGKHFYTDNHSPMRWYYMARNRLYINEMYSHVFPGYCAALLQCTKKERRKIWLFEKNKLAKDRAIRKGIRDYKKGIKGGTYEK